MEPNKHTDEKNTLHETNPYQKGQENPSGGPYGQPAGNTPRRNNIFNILMIVFLVTFLMNFFWASRTGSASQIEYSQFISLVESGNVDRVQVDDDTVLMSLKKDADLAEVGEILSRPEQGNQPAPSASDRYSAVRIDDPALVGRLSENGVSFYKPQTVTRSPILSFITSWIIPVMLMYLLYSFLFRKLAGKMGQGGGGGMGNISGLEKARQRNTTLKRAPA